jgi:threonylcarbamoyladenosine tRNA methylthiotransferase MtaB
MRLAVKTLGCKVNQVESDALVGLLKALEPQVVQLDQAPDLVVINTCAVTTTAEADARNFIRRARRTNPQSFIVVTGCYAELDPSQMAQLGADAVVPNARKAELPSVILNHFGQPSDPISTPPNEFWGAGERGLLNNWVRAFVKVQDGCNVGCAYCIIPRLRGRERHRESGDALGEARGLLEAGVQEIVLTGVRLGSYRGHPGGIAGLIEALAQMGAKVRLSSIEPEDTHEGLLRVIGKYAPQVRPHLHLSLQTGSARLLGLMGRKYDKEYYRSLVQQAYDLIPNFALTTDVIAGLPTETEEDHQETLEFLGELKPVRVHTFTYTPRPKTRAASMPQVPIEVRKHRNKELTALANQLARERIRPYLYREVEMLVESFRTDFGAGRRLAVGYTPDYYQVFATGGCKQGETVWIKVAGFEEGALSGEVVGVKEAPRIPFNPHQLEAGLLLPMM